MSFRFGDYELDPERFELRYQGRPHPQEPQVLSVLIHLIANRDRVVGREELLDAVWQDRFVSEATLSHRILEARRAIGDDGRSQRWIRTIHGRGFRFVGNLTGSTRTEGEGVPPGRQTEMTVLEGALSRACRGRSQIVFVAGPAGQGKTTLVTAFLQGCGARVACGQCLDQQALAEPFLPLLDALGNLGRGEHGVVERLLQVAPTWLVHLPALVAPEHSERLRERALGSTRPRMLRELSDALEQLSADDPLVVVLEDLHWADPSTLDAVRWLATRPLPAQLLLVATHRPGTVSPMAAELALRNRAERLELGPLDAGATAQLLERRGHHGVEVERLRARSGGNPLYMECLLDGDLEGLPQSLIDLVRSQVAGLEESDRTLLEAASAAAGPTFSSALLAAVLERSADEVEMACHRLALEGAFLAPEGRSEWADGTVSDTFRFTNDLFQEAIYSWLPAGLKARTHRRLAERLEQARGPAAELARHYQLSDRRAQAAPWLLQLAEQALGRGGAGEALACLDLALSCEGGPELEASLQALRSTALIWHSGWSSPQAEQALLRALELSRNRSPLLFSLATLYEMRGEYARCREVLEERLNLGDSGVDCQELLACTSYHQGDFARSLQAAEEGAALYDPSQGCSTLTAQYGDNPGVSCYVWGALAAWFLGDNEGALARARAGLELARSGGHQFSLALATCQAASLHQWREEPEQTRALAGQALAAAELGGYPQHQAYARILLGWAEVRLRLGGSTLEQGLELYRTLGANLELPYFLLLQADTRLTQGYLEGAATSLSEALTLTSPGRGLHVESELLRLQARAQPERAPELLGRALEIARRLQSPPLIARVLSDLG